MEVNGAPHRFGYNVLDCVLENKSHFFSDQKVHIHFSSGIMMRLVYHFHHDAPECK